MGNTRIVEHIDAAIRINRKFPGKVRIVTLDGQVVSQYGAMTGGSINKNTGVLTRANELERLRVDVLQFEDSIHQERVDIRVLKSEAESLNLKLTTAKEQLSLSELELSKLNAQFEAEKNVEKSYRDEIERIEKEQEIATQKFLTISTFIEEY